MPTIKLISLIAMVILFIVAGIFHFTKPRIFIKITPNWVPFPEKVNVLVGIVEIVLAIALIFAQTRSAAAMGIILLLIAVFPANVKHFKQALSKNKFVLPTLIRLPLQALLIYWAYTFI